MLKPYDVGGDKVTQQERMTIDQAISDLEAANKGDNVDEIKSKMDALMKAMAPISQRIYQDAQQAGAQQGAQGAQSTAGEQKSQEKKSDDGYVDADYKIVDDE